MTWILDEQRQMLADSARDFFVERAPVAQLRALRDRNDAHGYSAELWRAFGEQGYSSVLVDEAHGGLGLGVCEAGLIAEQIGHTLAAAPWLATAVLAGRLLQRHGSAAQQQAWLPRIAAAQTVLALALDETPRHRGARVEHTQATKDAEGWHLEGRKRFVLDGHAAEALIVAAKHEDGIVLLLVPAATPGVQVERMAMVDSHNAARIVFSGVRLPAEAEIAGGAAALETLLDVGRAVVAAELLGLADEVFARTLDYLKQRRQFDRAIGEFQALQHRAAELWCDLELTRAIVRQALQAIDDGDVAAPLLVAQAKARACLTANRAVQEGVQMHGGIGMTDELEIGFFMKRARVLQELLGDAAFQLDRAARLSGY